MLKKIIIGVLLFSVVGAGAAALAKQAPNPEEISTASSQLVLSEGQGLQQRGEPVVMAQESIGQPWQASGTITGLDSNGLNLALEDGETIYVELGPPEYWQAQNPNLQLGLQATVKGSENEGMFHATQVELADGQTLQLRTEFGQPLWSGGVGNRGGQNTGQANGERVPDPQAQVDEWVTISGTLMAFQGGRMTISTSEGEVLSFQTGQPRFFSSQGVALQVGDEVDVVGFFDGDQFVAGDITQVSTGSRVMLRDPNGRPLWAGPGNGRGNGQGGQ